MRCAHDAATDILTGPDTEDEFFEDLMRVTKGRTDKVLARHMIHASKAGRGMEQAFTLMLLALGATGLALLLLRATPAMGTLLAIHLGFVFGFFVTMPYGKFVHGLYRYAALVRSACERAALHGSSPSAARAKTSPSAAS